jgi:ABC-2 type transport system ATP-binding protein
MSAADALGQSPPLLEAHAAQIAIGDELWGELTLSTRGDRVLLVGDGDAVIAAISGQALPDGSRATLAAGTIAVAGKPLGDVALGSMPHQAAPNMTGAEFLAERGVASGVRSRRAAKALAWLELSELAKRRVGAMERVERRALCLAAALLGDPALLVLARPLDGLAAHDARWMCNLLSRATRGRAAIMSLPSVTFGSPEAALARGASDVCLLRDGAFVGRPGHAPWGGGAYTLTVASNADALGQALAARGVALAGGPRQFSLTLASGMDLTEVLEAASEARAAIVECVPQLAARSEPT